MGIAILMALLASQPSASDLLAIGQSETQRGNLGAAIYAFEDALDTRNLNLQGRVYVYWNLFNLTRQVKGQSYKTPDNLFAFIITAEDLRNFAKEHPSSTQMRFYVMYNIGHRLKEAKCMLDHYWENRDARIFSGCIK